MNTKLKNDQNLQTLDQQVNWSVSRLAKKLNVSVRTLERYFLENQRKTPKTWLTENRQKQAIELLQNGFMVKEIASRLGYKHAHHFSREFKVYWNYCPTDFKRRVKK